MTASKLTVKDKDLLFYVKGLKSEECWCGNHKKGGASFCYGCYRKLPSEEARKLYRRIGNGYCKAYDRCCALLEEMEASIDTTTERFDELDNR